MSVDLHREAENLMGDADVLLKQGRTLEAEALYAKAAQLEVDVLSGIPLDRPRTRGIIAVSAVSLYKKAAQFDEAILSAHRYLSDQSLPEFAREQLQDLWLEAERKKRAMASGRLLQDGLFNIALRGPSTEMGLARADTVILKLQQFQHFFTRIAEWTDHAPFRESGQVPEHILRSCELVVSQPVIGSFQFGLRLEGPQQLELPLFGKQPPTPQQVATAFVRIVDTITHDPLPEIKKNIVDDRYRDNFLRHVINLAPDGRNIKEIEISHMDGTNMRSAALTRDVRLRTRQYLPPPKRGSRAKDEIKIDVLRALHLNEGWIVLGEEQHEHRCYIDKQHKVYDDVVGPFVNRRVRVTGRQVRRRFIISDIALEEDEEVGSTDT